jgi:hypothetical protein
MFQRASPASTCRSCQTLAVMNLHRVPFPCVLAAASVVLAACAETVDESYATFADAQAAGAVVRGWVPEWLPVSASNIREAHNLDTNSFMVRFAVPKGTDLQLPKACEPVALNVPPSPPFRRTWWPSDVPATSLATHRHAFFGCGNSFVAFSAAQGEGFVWRTE